MLSSIRIANVNALGCASKLGAATNTTRGPSDVLVPDHPAAVVRCGYGGRNASQLLVGSYLLNPPQTDRLATALNRLVPDPCKCVHGGTAAPNHDEVLYFYFSDATVLRVNGAIGANLDSYSNRKRTVANYSSSIAELLAELTSQR